MTSFQLPTAVLVDRRNFSFLLPSITKLIADASLIGFDIETEDSRRHEGLNQFMKITDPEEGGGNNKLVFDYNRTNITGFSIYPKGSSYTFYFNVGHADEENRLGVSEVLLILEETQQAGKYLLVHNGPFEIVMLKKVWGVQLSNVICTMQLAVSCFNPDEYDRSAIINLNIGDRLSALIPDVIRYFTNYNGRKDLNPAQAKVVNQFIGKQSNASYSYNGIIRDISYGYGLKKIVKSLFGYQMTTFEEVLDEAAHMGQLAGDQVVAYGCDDAYWVVPLYETLIQYLMDSNPDLIPVFFTQENPMIYQYANVSYNGIRVNLEAIMVALQDERTNYYNALKELKKNLRSFLTEDGEWPHVEISESLASVEKAWYSTGFVKLRDRLIDWIIGETSDNPFTEVVKVNGAVAEPWWSEVHPKKKRLKTLSLTHYYQIRVILYDLMGFKPVLGRKRVVESDGPARNLLGESLEKTDPRYLVLQGLAEMSSIEQRIKLYINPYKMLTDPDTHRMYPSLNSMLATRRMAAQNPNLMQLSKSGAGAYVRGFFEPDTDEDMIVSCDWSQVELVLVGELSGDPEFAKCYSSLPYDDLHKAAMATCYFVEDAVFDAIKKLPDDVTEYQGIEFKDNNGVPMTARAFYKYARTKAGKVANFNYWYSGALASVGEQLGWTSDQMWAATEAYRNRFGVGEHWRTGLQDEVSRFGFVTLPDHHRRVRFEATNAWYTLMEGKFNAIGEAFANFAKCVLPDIQRRARNQAVNAMIQGTSATLAKRSIIRMDQLLGDHKARFVQPIHDELVYNVNKHHIVPFIKDLKSVMRDHKDIVSDLVLDCTAAIGLNFRPFDTEKNPIGQFELDEANRCEFLPQDRWDKKLTDEETKLVVDQLFKTREAQHVHRLL